MAKLKIVTDTDFLHKKSRPVDEITPRMQTLISDMVETMRDADGVGLAAPQVGVLRRIVVIEVEPGNVLELINPEIVESSGSQKGPEGCLSVPGKTGIVERPMYVTIRALDRNGIMREYKGEELLARAMCHETDHLDGIIYTDIAEKMLTDDDLEKMYGEE